jgi:hypothetical protein
MDASPRFTVPTLAVRFGVEEYALRYALRRHRIFPAEKVGNVNVYHASQLRQIEGAIRSTSRRPVLEVVAS